MFLLAEISLVEIGAVTALVTALIGAVVALTKLSGERAGIRITNEQGAATIYDNLVHTLQDEVNRLNALNAAKDARIDELEHENEGLKTRHGTRRDDPPTEVAQ